MSKIKRYSDTCDITNVSSNMLVEAVVQDFKENESLHVILNKSVKLTLKWSGKIYEGRVAGMDFKSSGPKVSITHTGSRG